MPEYAIRSASHDDVPTILRFIRELAEYEREPDAVLASEDDIHDALFSNSPRTFAVMCDEVSVTEQAPLPVGFAIFFYNFSTWIGKHGIYLEDLYVTPDARGHGAGKALLKAIALRARDEGCGRFEWSVLKWNTPSIAFYEACGAKGLDEWVGYRMDRAAIEAFVSRPD